MDATKTDRKPYPTDVGDEEWALVAPYLTLMKADAPQRDHALREVFNGLRWFVRAGADWRLMPHDLPPWHTVYQQTRRWLRAGVFEDLTHDLRRVLRLAAGRESAPTAAVLDGRTLQSSPESGGRAGDDGHKKRKGSKIHAAVDPLGHLLALTVTPANEQERAQVGDLAAAVQEATGEAVESAFVDQGCTGTDAAKRGFVLLPRRWVVERSFAWLARCRRLARDYERLAETLRGLHCVAFALLLLTRLAALVAESA